MQGHVQLDPTGMESEEVRWLKNWCPAPVSLRKQRSHVFLLITKIVPAFYVRVENNHMENYL